MAYSHKKFCCCNKLGAIDCDICHMSHCSIECKKKDIYHKFLCKKELCDSFRGLCYLYKFKKDDWGMMNLSDCEFFGRYSKYVYPGVPYDKWGCVICKTQISYRNLGNKTEISFVKYGNKIYGYRCQNCYNDNKILCSESLRERGICGMLKKQIRNNWMVMFGFVDVPMDVKKYVWGFMRMGVCEC